MNKNSPLLPAIGIVIALSVAAFGWYNINQIPDNEFPQFKLALDLQSNEGPFKLSDIQGKVGLVFFGYAHCPDVCPATMVTFAHTLDLLSEKERAKVRALFISLDPKRDTPESMAKYTRFFHPGITGLSGNEDQVEAAAKSFLIAYEKDEPNQIGNYSMNHSTYLFIVRPDGKLGQLMGHKDRPEEIAKVLRYWMKWAD